MLELRPTCEHCNTPVPPSSTEAMICGFECTFCQTCVLTVLHDVCPNCGGGFAPRPIRPKTNWNGGNFLGKYPPSQKVKHRPVDRTAHDRLRDRAQSLPPERR